MAIRIQKRGWSGRQVISVKIAVLPKCRDIAMAALRNTTRWLGAGPLTALVLFLVSSTGPAHAASEYEQALTDNRLVLAQQETEEEKKKDDKLLGCPLWEKRTVRSTTKLICARPGGDICTPDRTVCIEIPPGALERDTEITLTIAGPEFQIEGKEQLYPGAQLQPEGLTFRTPAKAIVRPSGTDDLSNVSLLLADTPDRYEELDEIEYNKGTGQVTGKLSHFSWLYPFLVNPAPTANPPSIRLHGGPGGPIFGEVGNGQTGSIGLRVILGPAGLVWSNDAGASETLVLQATFPTPASNQIAYATLTMIDPGPYTGTGPNVTLRWRMLVFNKIFGALATTYHPTGPDGIAIFPIRANWISWDLLPTGYPSGAVSASIQYFDQTNTLIGASTLVLSVARP